MATNRPGAESRGVRTLSSSALYRWRKEVRVCVHQWGGGACFYLRGLGRFDVEHPASGRVERGCVRAPLSSRPIPAVATQGGCQDVPDQLGLCGEFKGAKRREGKRERDEQSHREPGPQWTVALFGGA